MLILMCLCLCLYVFILIVIVLLAVSTVDVAVAKAKTKVSLDLNHPGRDEPGFCRSNTANAVWGVPCEHGEGQQRPVLAVRCVIMWQAACYRLHFIPRLGALLMLSI
jgi:hypothetical protein